MNGRHRFIYIYWIGIKVNTKLGPVFLILSTDKYFQMFTKQSRVATVAESFGLNFTISLPLTNK